MGERQGGEETEGSGRCPCLMVTGTGLVRHVRDPNAPPGDAGPRLVPGQGAFWSKPHIHSHLFTFRL